MNKDFGLITLNNSEQIDQSRNQQTFYIGGAFLLLNLFLMFSLAIYWTNTSVHQFFS